MGADAQTQDLIDAAEGWGCTCVLSYTKGKLVDWPFLFGRAQLLPKMEIRAK